MIRFILKASGSLALCVASSAQAEEPLNFNRDVRPILSSKCFACHGPDSKDRDADYRMDTKEGAFADLGGYHAIVPGDLEKSELIYRITTDDDDDLMPPSKHKHPLTEEEIEILKRWVKEGAPYAGHWAYEKVERPEVPEAGLGESNAVDGFIGAELKKKGLTFSDKASAETLIRRLHLDLTGLPPSPEEVEAFTKNPDAKAYEAAIERLMNSTHFAERMALEWLDVARFADTNGYSIDDHRDMWGWRDWVIDAFANNLPYDQFIRDQLAGDLIENATEKQKIATGFLRNSMNTHEGGTIAEEYRVAYVADKVDTVSTAFLGLTMKCAQCHDHKYDPISMRDYYQFFAFFNNSTEPGKGATNGNTKPFIQVSPLLQDAATFKKDTEGRIAALEYLRAHPEHILGDRRYQWEKEVLAKAGPAEETPAPDVAAFPFPTGEEAAKLNWIWSNKKGSGEFAWFRKTFDLAEVPARAQLYITVDNEADVWLNGKKLGRNPDWRTPTVLNMRPLLKPGTNVLAVSAKDWEKGKLAAMVAVAAFTNKEGQTRYLPTDPSWTVASKELPGWKTAAKVEGFAPAAAVAKHGASPWGNTFARLDGGATGQKPQSALIAVLRKPLAERTKEERKLVSDSFAKANSDMSKLVKSIDGEIGLQRKALQSGKTTVMVMDQAANRKTPILIRGQYDQHGEIVEADLPGMFDRFPDGVKADRLALANWLINPNNPLTARVTVNRYWQMLFGTGLVKTSEDFGSQGEWPSHPELLDWLAADFVASGWDVRKLLKTMLMSRTYQQSSAVSKELIERDPYNRLLARAPRFRLSAEFVRDNTLAIAGLLDLKVGGPSVYPPQPLGLWKEVSHFGYPGFFSAQHYFPDRGNPVYRRSMYSFWKRTSPPPVMATFDAPNRETCAVRRLTTNTPLQALVLLNAPQFVAASHALAERMTESGDSLGEQIDYGFRLATGRKPDENEKRILSGAYERQKNYFTSNPERAAAYLNSEKASADAAAMSSVAALILNLDETITRE